MVSKTMFIIFFLVSIILTTRVSCSEESHHETEEHHDSDEHHETEDQHRDDFTEPFHDHYDKSGHHEESYDHDAVTGSHHESEEFKDLEPEEAKRRLGLLFNKIDTNADLNISRSELFEWMIKSFKNLDIEDATSKIQDYDDNNDKKVSWGEYVTKMYSHSEKEIDEILKSKNDDMKSFIYGINMDRKKFLIADKNNDSALDLHEFTVFTHPHNYPEMASYEIEKTLEDFDKNKDGGIDLKEYIGDEKMDNETEKHEVKSFKEHDKDNNGLLQGSEIQDWMMPGFDRTASSEVEHLFKESDTNKDNLLSKEEVINQHELWVGSHATDYGKHLDDMKPHEEL